MSDPTREELLKLCDAMISEVSRVEAYMNYESDRLPRWYKDFAAPKPVVTIARALKAELTKPVIRPEQIGEIEKRHNELVIMYGGEPWDESCVEDGERAHMDRELLISYTAELEAKLADISETARRREDVACEALNRAERAEKAESSRAGVTREEIVGAIMGLLTPTERVIEQRPRTTIEELEKILNSDEPHGVRIRPDGSVVEVLPVTTTAGNIADAILALLASKGAQQTTEPAPSLGFNSDGSVDHDYWAVLDEGLIEHDQSPAPLTDPVLTRAEVMRLYNTSTSAVAFRNAIIDRLTSKPAPPTEKETP